ncbi:MAG: orotate phosphoribosyltransferase-like protein [Methanobacteriaceae archaeon]|jgi:orotate phosphoribosyltransferase|uniref:orotate phosphoribosyltransferase-like protein n=1 Tax=Methanobrevibacter TaxID=2172 RepID=UPI002A155AD8|nr:orotate phosphoribosyltransferase-like protein [Methanobacteriaceae archaeon]MDD3408225.1 orotate phosphoribosyltransferase-like protein [Methanobacteriaceae archaeon]MDD4594265.1 orotate phosphoribosyltransferase-like protein [Methanobacteriaceae archaeon]
MNTKLIKRASELRSHGFTTGEIADELNVSMDTARWLTLQKADEKKEIKQPADFAINWKSLGASSSRLKYISAALGDMAMTHGEIDTVIGVAISGIPFSVLMADFIEDMACKKTSLAVYHPNKHKKVDNNGDGEGAISNNFGSVEGKKVVIVDDVITSGKTMREVINSVRDHGAEPIACTVLIDKAGLSEVEGVPVESLIKVSKL